MNPLDFNCTIGIALYEGYTSSICQVYGRYPADGQLLSDLRDVEQWLIVNSSYSKGANDLIYNGILVFNVTTEVNNDRKVLPASGHGAWTDVEYVVEDDVIAGTLYHIRMSVSICYPASWTASLDVILRSSQSRTEPTALPFEEGRFDRTEPDVHFQMGEYTRGHDIE